jgi:hypothetical protein
MRGKRATAQAWGSLDQDYGVPRLADPVGGCDAGESGADDDDIRVSRRSRLGGGGQLLSGGRCHLRGKRHTPNAPAPVVTAAVLMKFLRVIFLLILFLKIVGIADRLGVASLYRGLRNAKQFRKI